ncbi:MAG: hypothetical protein AAF928_01405 [Myxococcota bacterium]
MIKLKLTKTCDDARVADVKPTHLHLDQVERTEIPKLSLELAVVSVAACHRNLQRLKLDELHLSGLRDPHALTRLNGTRKLFLRHWVVDQKEDDAIVSALGEMPWLEELELPMHRSEWLEAVQRKVPNCHVVNP